MAARPRKKIYNNLPDFLNFDKSKGKYILTLISGKRKIIGDDRAYCIALAREYNARMRPELVVSIESIISESGGYHGESKPLADHMDRLLERMVKDERPAMDTLATWKNDVNRIKEFFSNIAAKSIELDHVNDYINQYHTTASANVQNRKVLFLKKVFDYAVDESIMIDNPASRKKMRRVDEKKRQRLSIDDFITIRNAADPWLRTAMDLAIQTTQARLEISRIKYSIKIAKRRHLRMRLG